MDKSDLYAGLGIFFVLIGLGGCDFLQSIGHYYEKKAEAIEIKVEKE